MLPALLILALAQSPAAETNPGDHGEGFKGPRQVKSLTAVYPEEARRAGLSGEVVLEGSIDNKGKVTALKIQSGVSPLYEAAIFAVMEWQFDPAMRKGKPVSSEVTLTVRFEAQPFQYGDLMSSLDSATDTIRSTAARNLGGLLVGADVGADEIEAALQKLDELATTDQAPSVRSAARSAAARLRERVSPAPEGEPAPPSPRSSPSSKPVFEYDQPPKPIRSPRPVYPLAAFKAHIEGTVLVEVLIDAQGRVAGSYVIQSTLGLNEAALLTVRQWLFQPAVKNRQPVATLAHIPVQFRIY